MNAQARRRELRFDRILVGVAGGATALVAIGATALVLSPNPAPNFSGGEHLAIFARPSTSAPRIEPTGREAGVDMTPVGAINAAPASAAAAPAAPAGPLVGWSVQDVVGDLAYLIGPGGLVAARAGADLGEAGRVERIVVERGGFVVLTSKGRIGPGR